MWYSGRYSSVSKGCVLSLPFSCCLAPSLRALAEHIPTSLPFSQYPSTIYPSLPSSSESLSLFSHTHTIHPRLLTPCCCCFFSPFCLSFPLSGFAPLISLYLLWGDEGLGCAWMLRWDLSVSFSLCFCQLRELTWVRLQGAPPYPSFFLLCAFILSINLSIHLVGLITLSFTQLWEGLSVMNNLLQCLASPFQSAGHLLTHACTNTHTKN